MTRGGNGVHSSTQRSSSSIAARLRSGSRKTTAAGGTAAAAAATAANSAEEVARGLEALEAVAIAAKTSSSRSPPGTRNGSFSSTIGGGDDFTPLRSADSCHTVEASEPPGWMGRGRKEGRGMAALKSVAGSHGWSVPGSSASAAGGGTTSLPLAEFPRLQSSTPPPKPAGLSLVRINSDASTNSGAGFGGAANTRSSSELSPSFTAMVAAGGKNASPGGNSNSSSADYSPEMRFSKSRDSVLTLKSAPGICRSRKARPSGSAAAPGAAVKNNASQGAGKTNDTIAAARRSLRRTGSLPVADAASNNNASAVAVAVAAASTGAPDDQQQQQQQQQPKRSSSSSSLNKKKQMSPRAKGFSAIMFHESFTPVDTKAAADPTKKQQRGWWVEENNHHPLSPPPTLSSPPRRRAPPQQPQGQQAGEGVVAVAEGSRSAGGGGSGARRVGANVAALAGGSSIAAENEQLKLESRRLASALSTARESADMTEERSRVLAKQATLRVRGAEAQRAAAEEAAREAQAKAYSLSATVEVLKSTADCGVSAEGRRLTTREIEAEVTAGEFFFFSSAHQMVPYQGILQEMDMERADLQEQLMAVKMENNILRSRAMGVPRTPRTRSFSGATPTTKDTELEQDGDLMRELSPLPVPRSFERPKARGISMARDSLGSGDEGLANGSGGEGSRHRRGGARGFLRDVLGPRVRFVQLDSAGGTLFGAGAAGGSPPVASPSSPSSSPSSSSSLSSSTPPPPAEKLRVVAKPSAEPPPPPSKSAGVTRMGTPGGGLVLWYGRVSLVLAPCASAVARKGVPKAPATAAHWILLTDSAMYVVETRGLGAAAEGERPAARETSGLCCLKRHRLWSLSLPLETRALPNGDEVAVRSTAVVLRLNLAEEEGRGPGRGREGVGGVGGTAARSAGATIERGYLWLSCDTNEARGELVERIVEWHQWRPPLPRGKNRGASDGVDGGVGGGPLNSTADAARQASATAVGGLAASPQSRRGDANVSNGGDAGKGRGAAGGSSSFGFGFGEEEESEDEEEESLEVDQILLSELVGDLGEERSLNVTALLLADAEALEPGDVALR
ncbi:unnamed protein product [Ectocarpus sp. 12 AP-2014]